MRPTAAMHCTCPTAPLLPAETSGILPISITRKPIKYSVRYVSTDPEEPEPIYYQYKITSHIPEDSSNQPANYVHFTNCPDAEKLVRRVSFSKGVPIVESVKYVKGHKDSKGEDAPWTIVSHETGKNPVVT